MPNYRNVHGIHFLRLKGTVVDRAKQHGQILKDVIRAGAVPVLARRNQWMIRRGPGIVKKKWVHEPAVWAYENLFVGWLKRHLPKDHLKIIQALAHETGIDESDYLQAMFQPDGLLFIAKLTVMKHLLPEHPGWRTLGCSSAVVPPSWTSTGRMLHSRNLDYPIVGPWEANTTVLFHEPDGEGGIPHIAITSAGVHTSGLTAMNFEGLTLAIHAHFSKRVSTQGVPGTVVGDAIISRAKNLSHAIDIARKLRTTTNWAFVVSSANENEGAVIEITPGQVRVRHSDGKPLAHTNFFQSRELNADEGLICGMEAEDLEQRLCRMKDTIESLKGSLTAQELCRLTGNPIDAKTGLERVVGNSLSVVTTVKSAVFEPETLKFWVSARKESPTGLGDFVEVDTDHFWSSEGPPPMVQGYIPRDPALLESVKHYREAYRAWHVENEKDDYVETAFREAVLAAEAYPADGHLWLMAGLLGFKVKKFEDAHRYFLEARGREISAHARDLCTLFIGRSFDLKGKRETALEYYSHYRTVQEPRLRAALKKGLLFPYKAKDTELLVLDLQFPDALQY